MYSLLHAITRISVTFSHLIDISSVNSAIGVIFLINHIESVKKTISVSENQEISEALCASNGLNDFQAIIVMVFFVASLNSHKTWLLSHSQTETITVTEKTQITSHKILRNALILFERRF
jgi:hypothetical protein